MGSSGSGGAGNSGSGPVDVRAYYERLKQANIVDVARDLLANRITAETAGALLVNCPHHQSLSKRSLNISKVDGLFNCFGCDVGGDVLQLVEFIQSGQVSRGGHGRMPESHRAARDWLADRLGVPRLSALASKSKMAPADLEALEDARATADETFECLTALARIYHECLEASPEAVAWIESHYRISKETRATLMIGYAGPATAGAFDRLVTAGFEPSVASSTGAFFVDSQDRPWPFFKNRIVFPYVSRGHVVYLIGRRTPWTEDTAAEQGKYKKLPTWDEKRKPYISRAISNDHLWGEDVLSTNPKPHRVIITEGITDAIACRQAGFPVVSPCTVRLREDDVERIVRALRGVETVYLVQDNEVSGIGLAGAIATAKRLEQEKIHCLVGVLPLGPDQSAARATLEEILGGEAFARIQQERPQERSRLIAEALVVQGKSADEQQALTARATAALEAAKVDVCEFFRAGGTAEGFEAILKAARRPLEIAVDSAPKVADPEKQIEAIEPLLLAIAYARPSTAEALFRRLKDRLSGGSDAAGVSLVLLKKEASRLKQAAAASKDSTAKDAAKSQVALVPLAQPGTLRELIEREEASAKANACAVDWVAVADKAYAWFEDHGAIFLRTRDGRPSIFFEKQLLPMVLPSASGGGDCRYEGLVKDHSGIVPAQANGRVFYASLRDRAASHGKIREQFAWIHTQLVKNVVWLNFNNDDQQIAHIASNVVTLEPNGANSEGIILVGDPKLLPVTFLPEVDANELDQLLNETMGCHFACSALERQAVLDWISCFPLIQFSGTRPMLRVEGDPDSGKTFIPKLLTILVYGDEQQKKATDAANYVDAARNPLIALDNVETRNATTNLIDFLITSVTGIVREKRAGGTDSGTVQERPCCLISSNGAEPLGGDLNEVTTRTFVINCSSKLHAGPIQEKAIEEKLKGKRNAIWSALIRRTSTVLGFLRDDGQLKVMVLIRKRLGRHPKSRCDEFLALMYLQRVAAAPESRRAEMLEKLDPGFVQMLMLLNDSSDRISQGMAPAVGAIQALFSSIRAVGPAEAPKIFDLEIDPTGRRIERASTAKLFNALCKVSRDRGTPWSFKNPVEFGRRLQMSLDYFGVHGIEASCEKDRNHFNLFTFALGAYQSTSRINRAAGLGTEGDASAWNETWEDLDGGGQP